MSAPGADWLDLRWLSFSQLLQLWRCDIGAAEFTDTIGFRLASEYPERVEELLSAASGERLCGLLAGIGRVGDGEQLLRRFLNHEEDAIVIAAIRGVVDWQALEPLLEHPSGQVRGWVLWAARRLNGATALPLLLSGLRDPDPQVLEHALDELDELVMAALDTPSGPHAFSAALLRREAEALAQHPAEQVRGAAVGLLNSLDKLGELQARP